MIRPLFSELPPEAFLRLPEVIAVVSLKRSTIYDLIQRQKFPAPEKLTAHASGWRVGEIREWLHHPRNWQTVSERPHQAPAVVSSKSSEVPL
jgi:prophage regulatory protein